MIWSSWTCSSTAQSLSASKISPLTASTALQHALAEITLLVAVAQFDRLMGAGGGARGHRGAADRAIFQHHIDFDGGVAAAVEDFAADDVDDGGHVSLFQGMFGIGLRCFYSNASGQKRPPHP